MHLGVRYAEGDMFSTDLGRPSRRRAGLQHRLQASGFEEPASRTLPQLTGLGILRAERAA
jgi:hypothetical protein